MAAAPEIKLTNPAKERMRAGQPALGMNIRLGRSADIARIAKNTGHDFIFIDIQHSIFNLETIAHIAQTALAIGIAPLVRVRSVNDPDVSLLLDNGVTGIVFPDVATAADARKAVDTCRFAPLGKRSVSGGYPHFDYRSVPVAQAVAAITQGCGIHCLAAGMVSASIQVRERAAQIIHLPSPHVRRMDLRNRRQPTI